MDERERRRLLTAGLVGGEHRELYARSAPFHAAVDTLVGMLQAMVAGLADLARTERANHDAYRRQLAAGGGVRDVVSPLSDLLFPRDDL